MNEGVGIVGLIMKLKLISKMAELVDINVNNAFI